MQEVIVQTALRLFLQQGLRTTTMDQIADSLGISKKTLYEHFPSKEALIEGAANAFLNQLEARMQELRQAHQGNTLLTMAAIANHAYHTLSSVNPILFNELRRLLAPLRSTVLNRIRATISTHLTQSLQEGIQQGIFRSDLPVDMLPTWVGYAIMHIVLNPSFAEEVKRSIPDIYAETFLLLLHGFCTEKGHKLLETYKNHIRETYAR